MGVGFPSHRRFYGPRPITWLIPPSSLMPETSKALQKCMVQQLYLLALTNPAKPVLIKGRIQSWIPLYQHFQKCKFIAEADDDNNNNNNYNDIPRNQGNKQFLEFARTYSMMDRAYDGQSLNSIGLGDIPRIQRNNYFLEFAKMYCMMNRAWSWGTVHPAYLLDAPHAWNEPGWENGKPLRNQPKYCGMDSKGLGILQQESNAEDLDLPAIRPWYSRRCKCMSCGRMAHTAHIHLQRLEYQGRSRSSAFDFCCRIGLCYPYHSTLAGFSEVFHFPITSPRAILPSHKFELWTMWRPLKGAKKDKWFKYGCEISILDRLGLYLKYF